MFARVSVRACASDSALGDVRRQGGFWHVEEQVEGKTRDTRSSCDQLQHSSFQRSQSDAEMKISLTVKLINSGEKKKILALGFISRVKA